MNFLLETYLNNTGKKITDINTYKEVDELITHYANHHYINFEPQDVDEICDNILKVFQGTDEDAELIFEIGMSAVGRC